jgi:hypothetical protein
MRPWLGWTLTIVGGILGGVALFLGVSYLLALYLR